MTPFSPAKKTAPNKAGKIQAPGKSAEQGTRDNGAGVAQQLKDQAGKHVYLQDLKNQDNSAGPGKSSTGQDQGGYRVDLPPAGQHALQRPGRLRGVDIGELRAGPGQPCGLGPGA
jgi:hypothetical protein